jgi:hypothetical protein
VRSGQPRVFDRSDLSIDALLASACLPQIFRAVEIDGEPYWDGGYSGNPALWPLIYHTAALDILLVKINPLHRPGTPDTPAEIADRVNEITFNAGLVGELRAIGFVQRLLAEGRVDPGQYKSLRLHMVADDEGLAPLQASSKLNTEPAFLQALHDLGHAAGSAGCRRTGDDLGRRSSLDLRAAIWRRSGGRPAVRVEGHPRVAAEPDDLIVQRPEGLYCPAGDFHIDPWRPVPRAVITHAHADHARRGHGAYLATADQRRRAARAPGRHHAAGPGLWRACWSSTACSSACTRPATCWARPRCGWRIGARSGWFRATTSAAAIDERHQSHLRALRAGAL